MAKTARDAISRSKVVSVLRERGRISRSDLARELGLDKRVVSSLLEELLLPDGLVVPAGVQDSAAGRPQELFSLNPDFGNYIGIDLGATHIIGVLVDLSGRVLDRVFYEIRPGLPVDIIVEQMKTIGRRLRGSGATTARIRSIGACAPGFMDRDTGTSIMAENIPGWHDVGLKTAFESELALPVSTEDSSRAFAIAEKQIGEGRGRGDFLLLDLGYGIGSAVVINGALYTGAGNKSGEIGHMIVRVDGPQCTCGNRGCLEAVASGRAIAQLAAAGMREGRSSLLSGLTHGNPEAVTAQDVAIASSMGDRFSETLIRDAGALIGLALANAVNVLNPSRVILAGGLISANPVLEESITTALAAFSMKEIHGDLDVRVSRLGIDGSAIGSAFLAMAQTIESEP